MSHDRERRRGRDGAGGLSDRIERAGWALFLIMIGGILLVPREQVPRGSWLVGTGIILLGLYAARALNGLPAPPWRLVLGLVALALGAASVFGLDLPIFPIALILIGASMLAGLIGRRDRSGEAARPGDKYAP